MKFPITSEAGQQMLELLPGYYENSTVIRATLQAQGLELDKFTAALEEILLQAYVETATWALDKWEAELGIDIQPALTDQERRYRILGKLSSKGTCTMQKLQSTINAFGMGEPIITNDYANYQVAIEFTTFHGSLQANQENLLRAVVPAHLAIQYILSYATWDEIDARADTWAEIDDGGYTWAEFERL